MALVQDGAWLRLALGAVYFLAGTIKLYPYHQAGHEFLVNKFTEYAVVFPLAPIGLRPPADLYRITIGVAEAAMGLTLIAGCSKWCRYSYFGLMVIMVGATQTLICNKDYGDIPNPVSFFLALSWLLHLQKSTASSNGGLKNVDSKNSVPKVVNDMNGNTVVNGKTIDHNKEE